MSRFPLATALPSRLALACAISLAAFPAAASDDEAKTLDRVIVTATPIQPLTFETDPKLPRRPDTVS